MNKKLILVAISFFVLGVFFARFSCPHSEYNDTIDKLEKQTVFHYNKALKVIELQGAINSKAFDDFKNLADNYPMTKTIHIINCEGSINDEVNLALSKYIFDNGYSIILKEGGYISSGGTDLFLAGVNRKLEKNVRVGVHSWGNDKFSAADFPAGHQYHQSYIQYYQDVGMSKSMAEEFYYFTIYSAGVDGMYWLSDKELEKYKFERVSN